MASALLASPVPGVPIVQAANCTAAQLQPTLLEIAVDQGVGSYGKLVRGKQAIVRPYLTLPTGCTAKSTQSVTPRQNVEGDKVTGRLSGDSVAGRPQVRWKHR